MQTILEQELLIEKAIAYITPHLFGLPVEHKPTYIHSIRVGLYLYEKGYNMDVVIAGFLHDLVEDTQVTHVDLVRDWGKDVADMVLVNTKNESLPKVERKRDMMTRASLHSEGAAAIQAIDLLDGINYYIRNNELSAVAKRKEYGEMFLKLVKWDGEVFEELRGIVFL